MTDRSHPTWPRRFPILRMLGFALSLACGALFIRAWLSYAATPLERFYFPTYVRLTLFKDLPALPKPGPTGETLRPFAVVFMGDYLAMRDMAPQSPGRVIIRDVMLRPEGFARWLRVHIYGGRTLAGVLRWPLCGFGISLFLLVVTDARLDRTHDLEARNGRRLRGPGLTSRWRFNRQTKGDGLRFRVENPRNLLEWLKPGSSGKDLIIKRSHEAHHVQIAGDTGTGKSTIVRQIIYQIEARNEVAIIFFDPDREYIQEFFREHRGDWVLNPKDERCPYWPIGAEADDEAEATPIAIGLFPDEPTRQQFFLSHTRAIFSYLLATYKPTVNELAYWMAHPRKRSTHE